jgi:hypothetical protein
MTDKNKILRQVDSLTMLIDDKSKCFKDESMYEKVKFDLFMMRQIIEHACDDKTRFNVNDVPLN